MFDAKRSERRAGALCRHRLHRGAAEERRRLQLPACRRAEPQKEGMSVETGPYDDNSSTTGPRSPIMHLTEPPPFLRNSETSAVSGVTPRSRTCETRRPETPRGKMRKDSDD